MSKQWESLRGTGRGVEVFDEDVGELVPQLAIPVVFYCKETLL